MPEYNMQALNRKDEPVPVGSIIYSNSGERAELLKLTRWQMPGKSGKVYVQWIDKNGKPCAEYYDHVFGLSVKLVPPDPDRSIRMSEACEQLQQMITAFKNNVSTHSRQPSVVSRADLKQENQRISAIFAFLLRINGYNELPDEKLREEVIRCEMIIDAMYAKKK